MMVRLLLVLLLLGRSVAWAADGSIQLPTDGTGKELDTSTMPAGQHRQRINIGDPSDRNRIAHVNASGRLEVECTGCSAATVVNVGHVSAVTHIAASGPVPVVQSAQQGAWPVTAHQGGTWSATAQQGGTWTVQAAHQGGAWAVNVQHIAGQVHIAGTVPVSGSVTVSGTVTAEPSGSQTVDQGGTWVVSAHQAGSWTVTATPSGSQSVNQSGVFNVNAHVQSSVPVNQSGAWTATAHQAGEWNVRHTTSVTHIAGKIQANSGSGNLTCHSVATFAQSASGIVIHAAGANRIFMCGITLTVAHATTVSIVEGTGALCGTGTEALFGSTDAANGQSFDQNQGFVSVSSFPWIATRTAGANVCVLVGSAARVTGTISYSGIP